MKRWSSSLSRFQKRLKLCRLVAVVALPTYSSHHRTTFYCHSSKCEKETLFTSPGSTPRKLISTGGTYREVLEGTSMMADSYSILERSGILGKHMDLISSRFTFFCKSVQSSD